MTTPERFLARVWSHKLCDTVQFATRLMRRQFGTAWTLRRTLRLSVRLRLPYRPIRCSDEEIDQLKTAASEAEAEVWHMAYFFEDHANAARFVQTWVISPSPEEAAAVLGISPATALKVKRGLEKMGVRFPRQVPGTTGTAVN